jgi:hypothetical protein
MSGVAGRFASGNNRVSIGVLRRKIDQFWEGGFALRQQRLSIHWCVVDICQKVCHSCHIVASVAHKKTEPVPATKLIIR